MKGRQDGGYGGGRENDNHGGNHRGDAATWTSAAGAATYAGSSGQDWLYLGAGGATIAVSAVEKLAGGAGTDVVTLGGAGATLCVSALETLSGGAGTDVVTLGGGGTTLAVSGVETLLGGGGSDVVTVTAGTVNYVARGDAANLTLAAGNGADKVTLTDGGDGRRANFANTGAYNQIANFQTGVDQLVLSGHLRRAVDDNRDGVVATASVASGGINMSTVEVAQLTTTAASLTDADFTAARSAIGGLTNSSVGAEVVALVSDGTNTGAYLVTDANGDGAVAATEIKLLALFKNTAALSAGDIVYG